MSKILVLITFSFCLLGCAPSTSTFMKPEGNFGKTTIDGCGQIPNTFRYESEKSSFKISVHGNRVFFGFEAISTDEIKWKSSEVIIIVDGVSHSLAVNKLKPSYLREPCGGFTKSFNCDSIQHYHSSVDIPSMDESSEVIVLPPTPLVNGSPIKVGEIKFKKVTETLWQALNC